MPLVDLNATEKVELEDGDWYVLRTSLGFYENTVLELGGISVLDALEIRRAQQSGEKLDTEQYDAGKTSAEKRLRMFQSYLVEWSHPDPLTPENIKRIPPDHASVLVDKIKEFETASRPFRGEREDS